MGDADETESGSETSKKSLENNFDLMALHKYSYLFIAKGGGRITIHFFSFYSNCQVLDLKRNTSKSWEEIEIIYSKLYLIPRIVYFLELEQ